MTVATIQPESLCAAPAIAVVRAVNLGRSIDGRAILCDLNFSIAQGEFIALLGANGAGKSTLLKVLATLLAPTSGELRLFDVATGAQSLAIRRRIGLIGHSSMMYRDLSARENLQFFGRMYGLDPAKAARRAEELLEWVGLSSRATDAIKTYSRGMQQRVAIARALMHEPELLLADEPFAGLDAPSSHMLEEMLQRLHQQGRTIVLTTHDLGQGLSLSQRVLALRAGELVIDERPELLSESDLLKEIAQS